MNLRTAVGIFSVLVLSVFAALSMALVWFSDLLDSEARDLAKATESIYVANDLEARILIHNRNALFYHLRGDPSRLKEGQIRKREVRANLERMATLIDGDEERVIFDRVKQAIDVYLDERTELENATNPNLAQFDEVSRHFDEVIEALDHLIDVNYAQMKSLLADIDVQNRTANRIAFVFFVMGGFILLVIIAALYRYLTRPLGELSGIIKRYSSGEPEVRAGVKGLREVTEIGGTFNLMADRIEEKRRDQLHFIASIAHDLRNPLNAISMASDLLVRRGHEDERKIAKIIHNQSKSLDRLVGDLLDTTRIESGQMDLTLATEDIRGVIAEAVELNRRTSDIHLFRVHQSEQALSAAIDRERLMQVMNNLLSNAIKYSPNGGVVSVTSRLLGDQVIVSISDQGIGVRPEDQKNIFRPFHRTEDTKSTIPGIGLGLAVSRRIVEGHGGTLTIESSLGKGSTFLLALPCSERGPEHVTRAKDKVTSRQNGRAS